MTNSILFAKTKMLSVLFLLSILNFSFSFRIRKTETETTGLCKEKPPTCDAGKVFSIDQVYQPQSNGCGSEQMDQRIVRAFQGASSSFRSCCDEHDLCYSGQTVGTNYFNKSRKNCDDDFKECMYKKVSTMSFWKKVAKKSMAWGMYTAVNHFGCEAYQLAREKTHCK